MEPFFNGMAPEMAVDLAEKSRRAFDLREQRKQLLAQSGFADAHALLEAVREGGVDASAGYDLWLSLALLQEQHEALRAWVDWRCRKSAHGNEPSQSPWADSLDAQPLPEPFASHMTLHPDAVSFAVDALTGVARIVSATEWSLAWKVGERNWRLDTAPRRGHDIATRARLCLPDGSVAADPWGFDGIATRAQVLPHFFAKLADSDELKRLEP